MELGVQQLLPASPKHWASFHAGFDEFGSILGNLFPASEGLIIDLFDPNEMTERSIKRARRLAKQPLQSIHANFRALPIPDDKLDAAFAFFSAHELRKPGSRVKFFTELRRIMRATGKVIVLEHLRDWPNFFAFGPGCFHFHSRRAWLRAINSADLKITQEFKVTPFIGGFVLQKNVA
jgi:ubiquinone/menaquinone biosynthesis C-methylase UbiE